MNINYKSRLIPQIEKKYEIIYKKKLTFAHIIDKHFNSLQSIDTIGEELEKILGINIKRGTFVNAIQSEILKSENNISDMKYRPNAKQKNNPYRKKHNWNKNNRRVKNKWNKRKSMAKHSVIYKCYICQSTYVDQIYIINQRYGLQSYQCLKCKAIGQGEFLHGNKKITNEKNQIGLKIEKIS